MKIIKYNNCDIYLGTTAKDNWDIFDLLYEDFPDDIWFHLDGLSSPYVVLHECNDVTRDMIDYCALLCKSKSKHKDQKKLDIIYTPLSNLNRGKMTGSVNIISVESVKKIKK